MDYLAYAYLQGGQDKQALGVLDELYKIRKVEPAQSGMPLLRHFSLSLAII